MNAFSFDSTVLSYANATAGSEKTAENPLENVLPHVHRDSSYEEDASATRS